MFYEPYFCAVIQKDLAAKTARYDPKGAHVEALVSAAERPGPAPHRPASRRLPLVKRAAAQSAGKVPASLTRVMTAGGSPGVPGTSAFQSAL